MGDGRVALILDIDKIYRHAAVVLDTARGSLLTPAVGELEQQSILLFEYGPQEQLAVPLLMIRRIEEIHLGEIQRVGAQEYLTIGGQSIRVVRLDQYLRVSPGPQQDKMYLLLPRNLRQSVGILLSRILDTATLPIQLDSSSVREAGILGSMIVRGRMTLFLDLFRIGDRVEQGADGAARKLSRPVRRRILLVEDTQFFRHLVKGYLEEAGYEVVTAVNGALGLRELTKQPFDLVVSDIEMPEMDGWSLARAVREELGRHDLPLLALTTLSSPRDRQRALECGFNAHEVKVDRERFLARVAHLLEQASGGGSSHG
jgi:two-component system chemotaxis sensor kinase CheA